MVQDMVIPFPTLAHDPDEPKEAGDRPPHSRVRSSPTCPSGRRTQHRASPHVSPLQSPHRSTMAFGTPRRAPPTLTPPLTPSGSFSSQDNDGAPGTPEPVSPTRARLAALVGYPSPNHRSKSIPSTDAATDMRTAAMRNFELISENLTPRNERPAAFFRERTPAVSDQLNSILCQGGVETSLFVLIRNVPAGIHETELTRALSDGNVLSTFIQPEYRIVCLVCSDIQHAQQKVQLINGRNFAELSGSVHCEPEERLEAILISREQLRFLASGNVRFLQVIDQTSTVFTIQAPDCESLITEEAVRAELRKFKTFVSARIVHEKPLVFRVEYTDVKFAREAFTHVADHDFFHMRPRVRWDISDDPLDATSAHYKQAPFPVDDTSPHLRPRSVSAGESGRPSTAKLANPHIASDDPFIDNGALSVNRLHFGTINSGSDAERSPTTISSFSPDSTLVDVATAYSGLPHTPQVDGYPAAEGTYYPASPFHMLPPLPPPPRTPYIFNQPLPPMAGLIQSPPPPPQFSHSSTGMHPESYVPVGAPELLWYPPPHLECMSPPPQFAALPPALPPCPLPSLFPPFPNPFADPGMIGDNFFEPMFFPSSPPRTLHRGRLHPGKLHDPNGGGDAAGSGAMINEKNQLDLAKIESGGDTRTTVMIKNIPNKMSDQDLLRFIYKVCPNKIDFLYLRMDFQNGCNVGYAFVNFITVQDLLHFAKTCLNVRWNMYSSEKQLQMSYANYQGKEALVEKFKNSCIMDERESWRPKIFYSSGPHQGEPEPFPKPTHLRRKERSAHNRGALFVPSLGSQMHHHHHHHQQQQQHHHQQQQQHQHHQQQQQQQQQYREYNREHHHQQQYREQERFGGGRGGGGGGGRKGRDVGRGAEGGDGCVHRFSRA